MFDKELYDRDARAYALDLVAQGVAREYNLLEACLVFMSQDDVRDMLDSNELSPRFTEYN